MCVLCYDARVRIRLRKNTHARQKNIKQSPSQELHPLDGACTRPMDNIHCTTSEHRQHFVRIAQRMLCLCALFLSLIALNSATQSLAMVFVLHTMMFSCECVHNGDDDEGDDDDGGTVLWVVVKTFGCVRVRVRSSARGLDGQRCCLAFKSGSGATAHQRKKHPTDTFLIRIICLHAAFASELCVPFNLWHLICAQNVLGMLVCGFHSVRSWRWHLRLHGGTRRNVNPLRAYRNVVYWTNSRQTHLCYVRPHESYGVRWLAATLPLQQRRWRW